jgi:hypothetical protein
LPGKGTTQSKTNPTIVSPTATLKTAIRPFQGIGSAGISHNRKLATVIKLPKMAAPPPTHAKTNQRIVNIREDEKCSTPLTLHRFFKRHRLGTQMHRDDHHSSFADSSFDDPACGKLLLAPLLPHPKRLHIHWKLRQSCYTLYVPDQLTALTAAPSVELLLLLMNSLKSPHACATKSERLMIEDRVLFYDLADNQPCS